MATALSRYGLWLSVDRAGTADGGERMSNQYEKVEHPKHYQVAPGVEVIDLVEHLSFNVGNAVKYACRAGRKPETDAVTDLRKALWYLSREITRLHGDETVISE